MNFRISPWGSLQTRVTLFTLAIFLIGIWSLAIYASRMLREDMQRLLADQQFSTVSLVAAEVDSAFDDRRQALEALAALMSPAMLAHASAQQSFLEQRPFLNKLFNAGVFVTRLDGTATASVPRAAGRVGVNYLDRDYVAAALQQGQTTIGRPVQGRALKTPVVGMATPIRDARGRVIGALAGATDLSRPSFLDKIAKNKYGQTGGYLLNAPQYRLIVTATDPRRVMEALPAPGVNPLIDRFIGGYEGSAVVLNPRGVEVLASVKRVPAAGWYLAAFLPTEEAFAPIREMQQRMLIAALFLTLVAGGLTWWMLRRQLSPMLAAVHRLASLPASEQAPQPLPITRHDEIGELIGGFNRLLDTLAQREALLRQILDTSSVAIFLVDREGRITQANQRMAEMFGCSLDSLVGKEYVALVHPTERDVGRQKMLTLLASQIESVDLDRLYWRADRTEFWGRLTGRRFIDASGQDRGLVGVITDITDRKHAEDLLRSSEARYRSFLAELPLGIVITQDGLIKYVNRNMVGMIGYSENELLDRSFLPLVDEVDRPYLMDLHRRRMAGEDVEKSYVMGMVHKNGEVRQWRGYVCTTDWDGKPAGLGGFIDITESRQMEEQVRQLAFYDSLTTLANRRLLQDRMVQAMAASKRSACYGALMFLDLDNFKPLNDQYGHEVGDLLLIEVANRLRNCVRAVDTVARFGGDEFVVMLSELDADRTESIEQARIVAEKMRIAVAEPYLLTVRREGKADMTIEHLCTASIGIALFLDHEASPDELLTQADTAMYQAKEAGRNSIRVYASQNLS